MAKVIESKGCDTASLHRGSVGSIDLHDRTISSATRENIFAISLGNTLGEHAYEFYRPFQKTGTGRARRLANLRPPWSSENRPPGHTKSRKGIPNRKTILNHWMKAFEAQERMAAKAKAIKHRDAERKRRTAKKRAKELAAVFPRVVP